jgi:hypothetical protein
VALTPEQVREYGLPYAPMKDTERRKDPWRAAWGVDQTEIDSIATLQPDLLRRIALDAIAPFYDSSLARRVAQAKAEWLAAAQRVVNDSLDVDVLDRIQAEAEIRLAEVREQINAINEAFNFEVGDISLPPIEVPSPNVDPEAHPLPLISSEWDWTDQTRRLIDSKAYETDG